MPNDIIANIRFSWTLVGKVRLDANNGKLVFPDQPTRPGLYKFLIENVDGSKAIYVGETDNIRRRFAHYRSPGPSQPTNLRINALFLKVLLSEGQISVGLNYESAWIKLGATEERADLKRKDIRRLFENLILATQQATEIVNLNK